MPGDRTKRDKFRYEGALLNVVLAGVILVMTLGVWAVGEPLWQNHQLEQGSITHDMYESKSRLHSRVAEGLGAITPLAGGLALTATALAAIGNLRVAEDNRRLTEDRQATDLFVKAAEMLSNESLEVRLAGIYSLERIARDFPDDHWAVMELLMTFVRMRPSKPRAGEIPEGVLGGSPWERWSDPAPTDIGAALGVISQRSIIEGRKLKLRAANLGGVTFGGKANFQGADLKEANLYQASLPSAIFTDASLVWADLRYSSLSGADFTNADLSHVDLRNANITGAIFRGADLSSAAFDMRNKGMDVDQIMAAENWWNANYDPGFAIKLAKRDSGFAKRLVGKALENDELVSQMSRYDAVFTKQLGLSSKVDRVSARN